MHLYCHNLIPVVQYDDDGNEEEKEEEEKDYNYYDQKITLVTGDDGSRFAFKTVCFEFLQTKQVK